MQKQQPTQRKSSRFIHIEEFDTNEDNKFIKEALTPYLRDLFRDLALRAIKDVNDQHKNTNMLDKVTFFEYCQLPGILSDRFFRQFTQKNEEHISEASFISTMTKVFMSDFDTKMTLTFNMYDFDNDGFISKDDIRIVLSYIPLKRNLIDDSPEKDKKTATFSSVTNQQMKIKEGLYEEEQGKNLHYSDRISEQQDIKMFLEQVFGAKKQLNYEEYSEFNKNISSEMFFSIMSILHEKLPCAQNFFRLKRIYKTKIYGVSVKKSQSPARTIASPTIIQGISNISKNVQKSGFSTPNMKKTILTDDQRRRGSLKSNNSSEISSDPKSGSVHIKIGTFRNDEEEVKHDQQQTIHTQQQPPSSPVYKQNKMRINFQQERNLTVATSYKQRQDAVYSPITANKTQGIRVNLNQKAQYQQDHLLPDINSPVGTTQRKASQMKSTFSKNNPKNTPSKLKEKDAKLSFSTVGQEQQLELDNSDDSFETDEKEEQKVIDSFAGKQGNYVFFESECFLKTKTDRFKRHWAVLMGNEIYCYRNRDDAMHRVMHSLIGTYVKDLPDESSPQSKKKYYPLKILLPPNKSRVFYFMNQKDQNQWFEKIKETIGYSNLFDFYNIDKVLGKGQFGLVQLAQHKKSLQKVAIKSVKKKDMKAIEIYQQRREIEVLKMCQHPNIIKLIDLFENSDYYYIVLEYMEGKDLFDYLQKRSFKISEKRAKEIAYQIAEGLQYLHNYGIVHRDIKLENVMMSDDSDQASPKLVDFGLSKIMGPNEKAEEPFGTLGYVAPEVLKKSPYSFSCDLWSLGCITYALLSGSLPFDDDNQKETIRMTLNDPVIFDLPCWNQVSKEAKDLIQKLLKKDAAARITLKEVFTHDWFTKK